MKSLLRRILVNAYSFSILPQLFSGVKVFGGFSTFLLAGFAFSLISLVIKPILKIVTLPLNLLTFGGFSFFINVILLYILTIFVPQISIHAFMFQGFSFAGFIVPRIFINAFFAYIICSFVLSCIGSGIYWLFEK